MLIFDYDQENNGQSIATFSGTVAVVHTGAAMRIMSNCCCFFTFFSTWLIRLNGGNA